MPMPLAHVRLPALVVRDYASKAIKNMDKRREEMIAAGDHTFINSTYREIQEVLTTANLLCAESALYAAEMYIDHGLVAQMIHWAKQISNSTKGNTSNA